jgi:hypothetical protein
MYVPPGILFSKLLVRNIFIGNVAGWQLHFIHGVEVRITALVSDRYPWFSCKSVIVIGTGAIVIGN